MSSKILAIPISNPAIYGVNRQQSGDVLPLEWAVEATNLVINGVGKLSSRNGFREILNDGDVLVQHEYLDGQGGNFLILTTASKIYLMSEAGSVSEVTGTGSGGYWEFVNIRGGVYGMLAGKPSIFLTTASSSFTTVTNSITGSPGASVPSTAAHAPLAALGRLWCLDGLKLKYTDTLTFDVWDGIFDLELVWLNGVDNPTGLTYFNGDLVIFGEESLIVYKGDFDPTLLSLKETIGGLGCPYPRTIRQVGNDVLFLSRSGVRQLSRTIQEGKMPVGDATIQIQDFLATAVRGANPDGIQAIYDSRTGYYLLMVSNWKTIFVLHTRLQTPLGTPPITEWSGDFKSIGILKDRIFAGLGTLLTEYRLTGDSTGTSTEATSIKLRLPWWGIIEDRAFSSRIKNLKRAFVTIGGYTSSPIELCWRVDYSETKTCLAKTIPVRSIGGYANPPGDPLPVADWDDYIWFGESEFATVAGQTAISYQLSKSGLVVQLEVSTEVLAESVVIQNLSFQVKVGRLQA